MRSACGDRRREATSHEGRPDRGRRRIGLGQHVIGDDVEDPRPVADEGLELGPIGPRHPEQLADDVDGQPEGERLDEVDRPRHRVEQIVDHALDRRPQRLHPAGGERAAHEAAQPRVVGRVDDQHAGEEVLERGPLAPVRVADERQHVRRRVGEAGIAGQRRAVGVPRDDQRAVDRPHDRRDLAQPVVAGIRILAPDHRGELREELVYSGPATMLVTTASLRPHGGKIH
jgi:hypothetical protein